MTFWSKRFTLDFLIISFMFAVCAACLLFNEMIPADLFLIKNTFKNNPEYIYKQNMNRMMVCSSTFYSTKLDKFYRNPELLFENTAYDLKSKFKNKKTAIVIFDNVHVVVHRFSKKGFWSFISSLAFPSNAFRGWQNGHTFKSHEILCAKPLLVIEKRLGPFCTTSYLLTNYITGLHGAHFFRKSSAFQEKWGEAASNLQETFLKLEGAKIRHINFGLKSFIFKNEKPYLIDLDRYRKFRSKHFLLQKKVPSSYFSLLYAQLKTPKYRVHNIFYDKDLCLSP